VIWALLAAAVALSPADVLERYASAVAGLQTPAALTFQYALEQTGMRNTEQVHRVFRTGNEERDELLSMDGHKLSPPNVRIFHGKRNRYTLAGLAPRFSEYTFRFIGPARAGKDYVFAVTPRTKQQQFAVTRVTIDGAAFVPSALAFTTVHEGSGSLTFAKFDRYWLPTEANARASYKGVATSERLTFGRYRFPTSLPPATFAAPRALDEPD
jgi:hypothetical protein